MRQRLWFKFLFYWWAVGALSCYYGAGMHNNQVVITQHSLRLKRVARGSRPRIDPTCGS